MFLGVFARSSTPLKRGLMVANGVGVVDSRLLRPDRRGQDPGAQLHGVAGSRSKGDRIAQGILLPSPRVEWEEVGELRAGVARRVRRGQGVSSYQLSAVRANPTHDI